MPKVGRNDLCPCGSGEKYKKCCMHKKRQYRPAPNKAGRPLPQANRLSPQIKVKSKPDYFSYAVWLLIIIVVTVAYRNSFTVPFVFDDGSNIVQNLGVHLEHFTPREISRLRESFGAGRILSQITYAANYYFNKGNTWGYHLFNLIVHILGCIVLYEFLLIVFTLPGMKDRYGPWAKELAGFTSLIFAAHPVNTQAVTYIVQRCTSMFSLFSILCLIFYIKWRRSMASNRWMLFLLAIISGVLAYNSKQNAVILPLLVALVDIYFFPHDMKGWFKQYWPYMLAGVIIPIMMGLLITDFNVVGWIQNEYAHRDFTFTQRVLTEWRILIYYFTLIAIPLPTRLNLDYDFPLSNSLLNPPTTLLSLLLIIGLIVLAVQLFRKEPLVSFAIVWYFINLVIESSFMALDLAYDHRLYFPMIFIIVAVVWGMLKLTEKLPTLVRYTLRYGLVATAVFMCTVMIFERNKTWQSVILILEDVTKKAPDNSRQHINLGVAYSDDGRLDDSIREYLLGIKLKSDYPEAYNNLGNAYNRKGMWEAAVREYLKAIRMRPTYKEAHNNLGSAYCNMGRYDDAINEHMTALRINPECEKSHNNLGVAYSFKGMYDEAIEEYKKSLQIVPGFTRARSNLALAYNLKGKYDEAIAEFNNVLRDNPSDITSLYNIGNIYNTQGKFEDAIRTFGRILQIQPNHAEALNNIGLAYKNMGKYEQATEQISKAIAAAPNYAEFYFNLGLCYREMKRYKDAEQVLLKSIQLKPNLVIAYYNLGLNYEVQKKFQQAAESYEKALQIAPNFALAYKQLGVLLINVFNNPQQGAMLLQQAIQLQPDIPDAGEIRKVLQRMGVRS